MMSKPRKLILRLIRYLVLLLVLFTLVLMLQTLILPGVVRRIVEKRFTDIGLQDVTLEIRSVTWQGAELANIRLDEQGQARIGALAVRYTPVSLLQGTLNMVEITGMEFNVNIQNGTIDLGILHDIKLAEKEEVSELPFEQIDLRSSSLCVQWEEKKLCFPVAGFILNVGQGSTEIDLDVGVQGTAMNLQGKVCVGEKSWHITSVIENLDVRTLLAYLPRDMVKFPLRAGGKVTVNLQGDISRDKSCTLINLDLDHLWLKSRLAEVPISTEAINGKIHLQVDDFQTVTKLNGNLTADELEINSIPARHVQLDITKQEDKLLLEGKTEGDKWFLQKFTGAISQVFPLNPKQEQSAGFTWHIQGRLPKELTADLQEKGVDITHAGAMQVSGSLQMKPSRLLSAQIPQMKSCVMQVDVAPGNLAFRNGMQLEQVSGTAQIIGASDPNGTRWQIVPPSKIAFDAFRDRNHDLYIAKAPAEKNGLELILPDNAVDIWIPYDKDRSDWHIQIQPLTLQLNRCRALWNEDTLCEALEGRFQLQGYYTADGFTFGLRPEGWIRFGTLENTNPMLSPWKVTLQDKILISQGKFNFDLKQQRTHWTLQADIPRLIQWDSPGFRAKTNGLRFAVEQTYTPEGKSIRADLSLKSWQNHFGSNGYALESYQTRITAHAKVVKDTPVKVNAELLCSDLVVRDEKSAILCHLSEKEIAPISLFADGKTRSAVVSLDWPIQENAHLRAQADLDFRRLYPQGQISVRCEGLQIDDEETLFKNIIESTGWQLRGIVSLDANIQIEQNRIHPRVTLSAKDTDLQNSIYDTRLEGIEGTVTFTGGFPLTTPGGQRFHVREAMIGTLNLHDGLIVFRLENDPPAVFIENTDWHWAGGRLYEHALRIDPDQNEIPVRFFAEGLQVSEVFDFVLGEDVTGQGNLYGMLPIIISRKNLSEIQLGPGYLYAAPEGGWWKIRGASEQALRHMILGSDASTYWTSGQIDMLDRILLGLTHFEFDTLKIDLLPEPSALQVRLTTTGRSADRINAVEYKQVIIEIPRFDQNLQKILWIRSEYQNLNKRLQNLNN